MIIGIVDITIFCEILQVPSKSQQPDTTLAQLGDYIERGFILLLPMATIIETGNHIAQNGDGRQRRIIANRFVQEVRKAIGGEAPWTVTRPPFDPDDLKRYLDEFPDYAMRGTGLGDLSIIKEFERQCEFHPHGQVFIWSLDQHLCGYMQQGDF